MFSLNHLNILNSECMPKVATKQHESILSSIVYRIHSIDGANGT